MRFERYVTFLLILISSFLTGCQSKEIDLEITHPELWNKIVNQEFTADNGWAGEGLYFYEEDSNMYCVFMVYGSGVRVAGMIRFDVSVNEEDNLVISLPSYDELTGELIEIVDVVLEYDNETIIWDGRVFEDLDSNMHPNFYEDD